MPACCLLDAPSWVDRVPSSAGASAMAGRMACSPTGGSEDAGTARTTRHTRLSTAEAGACNLIKTRVGREPSCGAAASLSLGGRDGRGDLRRCAAAHWACHEVIAKSPANWQRQRNSNQFHGESTPQIRRVTFVQFDVFEISKGLSRRQRIGQSVD